jgi:ketol-acid reductoisomerase
MATVYHDEDADLGALAGQTLAVVGYGNQGRSQALNLRDSGLTVIVGNVPDASADRAREDGFDLLGIAAAAKRAQVVLLLVPDEVMPAVYHEQVAPNLQPGTLVDFASGYNVAFGLIEPAQDLDVGMVAPRMIGPGVRDTYLRGPGFPSFVGVHQDATGTAKERVLALAKGLGSTRAGCLEMSLHDEASLDLFTEQGFGPAFGRMLMTAVDVLVEAGYPPEAVLLELYLSGELGYTFEKIREVGITQQMDFHSRTSQYGSITRGIRYLDLGEPAAAKMRQVLDEIRSGAFAEEWSGAQSSAGETLDRIKAVRDQMPIAQWDADARKTFGIGRAGTEAEPARMAGEEGTMAAKKKAAKKKAAKKKAAARIEAELPKSVRAYTKEVRKRLTKLERDIGKARAQASRRGTKVLREASEYVGHLEARGEKEFRKRRGEAVKVLKKLEKAIAPKKKAARKRRTAKA